jgi:predicted nucleic acid-binding protein
VKRYLVDTNVPSELIRLRPDDRVQNFLAGVDRENIFISVLTIGEICKGIALLPASQKRTMLQNWLDTDVRPWFAGRILPVTETVAERWGQMAAAARQTGFALTVIDGLIAATALENGLTLLTRNDKDFAGLGVDIVNPWTI